MKNGELYIDASWGWPDLTAAKADGYTGIMGYVSDDRTGKNLKPEVVTKARTLGMGVGLVWENAATDLKTRTALWWIGAGQRARGQASKLGYPTGLPIFAAADYDAPSGDFPVIASNLAAFAKGAICPRAIYGEGALVDWLISRGKAEYGWQAGASTSWPGNNRVSPYANLYQRRSKTRPAITGSYDENVVLKAAPWAWLPTPVAPPTPTPIAGRQFAMLNVFALGDDHRCASAIRGAWVTDNLKDAQAAHTAGEKLVVLGGPASTAIGLGPGQHGNTTVIVGHTYKDTFLAAANYVV